MLHNLGLLFDAAWKVLAVGLLLGAGLPALFALGIRSMAYGVGGAAEPDSSAGCAAATPRASRNQPRSRVKGLVVIGEAISACRRARGRCARS